MRSAAADAECTSRASSATPPQLETAFLACENGEEEGGAEEQRRGERGTGGERGAEDVNGGGSGAGRAEGAGRRKPARSKRPPKPSIDDLVDAELADSAAARQSGRIASQSQVPHLPPLGRFPRALPPGPCGHQAPLTDRIYPRHSPCSDPGAMSSMASARMPSIKGQRPRSGGSAPPRALPDSPMSRARLALKQFKSTNGQHVLAAGADSHGASGAPPPAPRAAAAAWKQPTIFERYSAANVALDHRRSSTILQNLIHNASPAF